MKKYITGDLLHYKICNAKYLIEVTNTSKHGYCFKGVKDDFNGVICDEFIEDIPLTPEILEKNGWKDDGYDWYRLPTKRAYLYITKDMTTLGEFLVCVGLDRHNIASISFVHQLQHLLFGLGLNSEIEV